MDIREIHRRITKVSNQESEYSFFLNVERESRGKKFSVIPQLSEEFWNSFEFRQFS